VYDDRSIKNQITTLIQASEQTATSFAFRGLTTLGQATQTRPFRVQFAFNGPSRCRVFHLVWSILLDFDNIDPSHVGMDLSWTNAVVLEINDFVVIVAMYTYGGLPP
jgi:hypothetical protein